MAGGAAACPIAHPSQHMCVLPCRRSNRRWLVKAAEPPTYVSPDATCVQGHLFSALRQTRLVPAEASWQVGGRCSSHQAELRLNRTS